MIRILVGDSLLKFDATQQAIELIGLDAEVNRRKINSRIPPQPIGKEQTLQGAWNRASSLKMIDPSAYAAGIESGLIPSGPLSCDVTYVTVITPSGKCFVRKSLGVIVPKELVEAVLACGQTRTAGEFEADRTPGCDHFNPHPVWSKGKIDRRQLLTTVLYSALFAATIHEEGESP